MHPYALHRVMVERGKTGIVPLPTRSTLYQLLERLARAGFVEAAGVERDGARPDRTLYRLTDAGGQAARAWLLDYLAAGSQERAGFVAALSSMMMLMPTEARKALTLRRERLAAERADLHEELARGAAVDLPRLFQLDEDYRLRQLEVDLSWLDALLDDLDSGRLTWDREYIAAVAARLGA